MPQSSPKLSKAAMGAQALTCTVKAYSREPQAKVQRTEQCGWGVELTAEKLDGRGQESV